LGTQVADLAFTNIDILVIEAYTLVAHLLEVLLTAETDFRVVGVAGGEAEGLEMALSLRPDVVLVDYWLRDASGSGVARQIARRVPRAGLLFLSATASPAFLLDAARVGARGYVLWSQAASDLIGAVRKVAAGDLLMSGALARIEAQSHDGRIPELTAREAAALGLLAQGMTNRAIAEHLGIRYTSVRGLVRNILFKLDVHSRLEAVARAYELGFLGS
jgi:DNA-binding NarL/FixJ family response regulator